LAAKTSSDDGRRRSLIQKLMIKEIIEAAIDAGRVIEDIRARGFSVESKGDQGPVTEADRAADSLLKERLLSLEKCGWLSEETTDSPARLSESRLWVVDPLDGTKEFAAGIPEYSVAVALVEDGEAVMGVVHCPPTGETTWAVKGEGARNADGPISVSEQNILLASRSEIRRGEFAPFMEDWQITHLGSIEYKLARIAAGMAGGTLSRGPKWEWDVCAGALIVQEAGGRATDVFGNPFVFNQEFPKVRGVLAGAPGVYERVRLEVAAMGASDRMDEFNQ
jgi:myo-inositol-1(or 4)-monophosphatase